MNNIRMTKMKSFLCVALMFAGVMAIAWPAKAQTAWDLYQNAVKMQESGQTGQAIAELEKAIALEPDNAFYHNAIGLAYIESGNMEKAMVSLTRAVEINNDLPEAHSGLGVAYNAKKDYEKSIEHFKKALDITPESSPDRAILHNNIGQDYYLMRKLDEAETELRKAIELNDKLLTAHINLGNVFSEKGDYKTAIENHKKAVELAPEYALPRNNLAFAYYKTGDFDSALDEMRKVIEIDPANQQFKKNYEFLKAEKERNTVAKYEDGVLAGLPKEVRMKEKMPAQVEQPEEKAEPAAPRQAEETVAAAPEKAREAEKVEAPAAAAEPEDEIALAPAREKEYKTRGSAPAEGREHVAETPSAAPSEQKPVEEVREPAVPFAQIQQPEPKPAQEKPASKQTEQPIEQPATQPEKVAAAPVAQSRVDPELSLESMPPEAGESELPKVYDRQHRKGGLSAAAKVKEQEKLTADEEKPQLAAEYYRGAKYNIRTGDLESAEKDISRALDLYPDNLNFQLVEGLIKERKGMLHEASIIYSKVIQQDPTHSGAHSNLGHVNQVLGRLDIAEEEYKLAYESDPVNGCAAGNVGSMLVFQGKCDEAMEYLTTAAERQCLTASVLNNISLCYFKSGDIENAQSLSYRALEKEPRDQTILSNFSFIVEKSEYNYSPIVVSGDTEYDPFYKLMDFQKETPLYSLTKVEPLDFYEVFRNTYNQKTVLVVPFENPRGTERWTPTPSEIDTRRLANSLRETGYFKVIIAEGDYAAMPFTEKVQKDSVEKILKRNPVDIVYFGNIHKQELADLEKKRYKGLKKNKYVEGKLPIDTRVVLAGQDDPLYDQELAGRSYIDGVTGNLLEYSDIRVIKDKAFDDYCESLNNLLLDHYHLLRHPVRKDVVRYLKRKPWKLAEYRR